MARVLISMKDEFLDQVDEIARVEQRSRSELIREALRVYIRRSNLMNNPRVDKESRAIEAILNT